MLRSRGDEKLRCPLLLGFVDGVDVWEALICDQVLSFVWF